MKLMNDKKVYEIEVIRGHIGADGGDICTVSTGIDGLRERVGEIEQPKNAWIEIARQARGLI